MKNTYKELISNEEFFAAALLQIHVSVFDAQNGEEVDCGGLVQKYTEFSVRIGGVYYQRHMHVFKIMGQ